MGRIIISRLKIIASITVMVTLAGIVAPEQADVCGILTTQIFQIQILISRQEKYLECYLLKR